MTPFSVFELTRAIKEALDTSFGDLPFWVRGEVSNYRGPNHASGHLYFNLKDDKAVLPVAFFARENRRMDFALAEGMKVLACGRLQVYEPQGKYQFIIQELRQEGLGDLYRRFEELKKKLETEGLFLAERKKRLPFYPVRLAVLTSPSGAVVRDILKILSPLPRVEILVFPIKVQGDTAAQDIAEALAYLSLRKDDFDAAILARGGGSIEDLWCFNEELVARAIAACPIPLISAIGHQTDFTIADFVADIRAATPTNAAEIIAAQIREVEDRLERVIVRMMQAERSQVALSKSRLLPLARSMSLALQGGFQRQFQHLDTVADRLQRSLNSRTQQLAQTVQSVPRVIDLAIRRRLTTERNTLAFLSRRMLPQRIAQDCTQQRAALETLNHRITLSLANLQSRWRDSLRRSALILDQGNVQRVLNRGFSVVRDEHGQPVLHASSLAKGQILSLQFSRGQASTTVEQIMQPDQSAQFPDA